MSSSYYSRPPSERSDIRPPMDVSRYMGLMVPWQNHTWPESRRFVHMHVNIDEFNSETVSESGHEYMSVAGGWLKLWWHLDNRGARSSPTNGLCDMRWVRCYEGVDYQLRLATLVASASSRYPVRTPTLDVVCFDNTYNIHWSIARHHHFYRDLDMDTRLRNYPLLG